MNHPVRFIFIDEWELSLKKYNRDEILNCNTYYYTATHENKYSNSEGKQFDFGFSLKRSADRYDVIQEFKKLLPKKGAVK